MRGRWISYSQQELNWVKARCTMDRKVMHQQFCSAFSRSDVSLANLKSLCKRNGWLTGRTGHFNTGQTSWNKGKKMPYNANSARTQFRKGQPPHNAQQLGHERISKEGYVEVSIDETNPHTGSERRYVLKHKHLWEKANGPVPQGMCLKCIDGDKTNTATSNWELVPRALLPRLNGRFGRGYDKAPAELKPTILTISRLEHAARSARSNQS